MSTIAYGICHAASQESPDKALNTLVVPFARGAGFVFGIFGRANTEKARAFAHLVREELARLAATGAPLGVRLEAQFEGLVTSFNEEEQGIDDEEIPIVIGALTPRSIMLTSAGAPTATLIRRGATNTFHVYDLLRNLQDTAGVDAEPPLATKPFRAIVSGELEEGDSLGIALGRTVEVVGGDGWKRALATMAPPEAGAFFRHTLKTRGSVGDALIFQIQGKISETQALTSTASIEELRKTERTTEKFLGGAMGVGVLPMMKRLGSRTMLLFRWVVPWLVRVLRQGTRAGRPRMHVGAVVERVVRAPASLVDMVRRPRRGEARRRTLHDLRTATTKVIELLITRFNALPRISKLLFVAVLVFVVLFIQSIVYLGYRREVAAAQTSYRSIVEEIERRRTDAEASLIYRDEEKARQLLLDARSKIAALPRDSRSRRHTAARLETDIEKALVGLRHEIVLNTAAIRVLDGPPEPNSFDYPLALFDDSGGANPVISFTTLGGRTLLVRRDGSIERVGTGGEREPLQIPSLPGPPADAKLFGTRLYLLIPSASQVYRLSRRGETFGSLAPWISDGSRDLRDARSVAIDGAIYVLRGTEVVKFFTGVREDWKPYIDPPLEQATRIWTSDEVEGIYILEPERRRIIVLSKLGALLAQYIFPEGSNLRDFAVDETEKKLSVLNNDRIEEIYLSHLNN